MSSFITKTFIVQQYPNGLPGEVVGCKLTFNAAHALAKTFAPAKVIPMLADKSPYPNAPEYVATQSDVKLISSS